MLKIVSVCLIFSQIWANPFYFSNNKKIYLKKDISRNANTYNLIGGNEPIIINDDIIFKLKKLEDLSLISQKYNLYNVQKLHSTVFQAQTNKNTKQSIDISNNLYQDDLVIYAHPNFEINLQNKSTYSNTNPLRNYASHLNLIDVDNLWEYSKGENVRVAIIDDSVDVDHIDLKDNYISTYENTYNYSDSHGTNCLGIISALDNSIGSVGIAPMSKFYVVKLSNRVSELIKGVYFLINKDVAVVNNSWGTSIQIDALEDAFEILATEGRNGKGTVVVFASGNSNLDLDKDNYDLATLPFILGVGALNEDNLKASYSNYGKTIDVYAYGGEALGITTTDYKGGKGNTQGDYYFSFRGTSASAPIVSGVVALMAGVDKNLKSHEIIDIIKKTSKKSKDGYSMLDAKSAIMEIYIKKYGQKTIVNNFDVINGWNLLGNPQDISLEKLKDKFINSQDIWIYKNKQWLKNPTKIEANSGFWIEIQ